MIVKEWGMIIEDVPLFQTNELERISKENELEINTYFREETFLYTIEILWNECSSENQKRHLLKRIKKLLEG